MTKVIPFPARRVRQAAEYLLRLSASQRKERLSKPRAWKNRPVPLEPLGNMLQRLALERPVAVLLFENIVADMLAVIERDHH